MSCNGTLLQSTTTDANGRYAFSGLPAGSYRLVFSAPGGAGYTASPAGQGGNTALDSNIDALGATACIEVVAGETRSNVDAGFVPGVRDGGAYGPASPAFSAGCQFQLSRAACWSRVCMPWWGTAGVGWCSRMWVPPVCGEAEIAGAGASWATPGSGWESGCGDGLARGFSCVPHLAPRFLCPPQPPHRAHRSPQCPAAPAPAPQVVAAPACRVVPCTWSASLHAPAGLRLRSHRL